MTRRCRSVLLHQPLLECLEGEIPEQELFLDGVNRRGKPIRCQVRCTPLFGPSGIDGAIVLVDAMERG